MCRFFRSDICAFNTAAADATAEGFDVALEFAPNNVPGLLLRAELDCNESRFDKSVLPCYAGQTPVAGCTLNVGGARLIKADGARRATGFIYVRPIHGKR